jgi:hypothetical protein
MQASVYLGQSKRMNWWTLYFMRVVCPHSNHQPKQTCIQHGSHCENQTLQPHPLPSLWHLLLLLNHWWHSHPHQYSARHPTFGFSSKFKKLTHKGLGFAFWLFILGLPKRKTYMSYPHLPVSPEHNKLRELFHLILKGQNSRSSQFWAATYCNLKVWLPTKNSKFEIPTPPGDGIRGWGSGEVISPQHWSPHE